MHSLEFSSKAVVLVAVACTMAARGPSWWISGKVGCLSPMAHSKTWALCTVCQEEKGVHFSDAEIASKVTKVGGGHPSKVAIFYLRRRWESDPGWHPGKASPEAQTRGPKRTFTLRRQRAVAQCAMSMKRQKLEPTAQAVVAACPAATKNPNTGDPYDKKVILKVFRTLCYDNHPSHPWGHVTPVQKTALSPEQQAARLQWSRTLLADGRTAGWYYQNCIFAGPCNTVVSPSAQTAFDEHQATYGKGKRWMSSDSRMSSRNLKASPYAGKQKRFGDKRVWWFVILTRGRVCLKAVPSWLK